MLEPAIVSVNGRDYTVIPFNPSEALEYLHALILARATGRHLASLGKVALHHCVTPEGKGLDNEGHFQEVFSQFPADMLELETMAIDALCDPWEGKANKDEPITKENE